MALPYRYGVKKRKHFTAVESEAVKQGYKLFRGMTLPHKRAKMKFSHALRRRNVVQICNKLRNVKHKLAPSEAPNQDANLAICLGVEFFGPENPDESTFASTKELYGRSLAAYSTQDMAVMYAKLKEDEILSQLD